MNNPDPEIPEFARQALETLQKISAFYTKVGGPSDQIIAIGGIPAEITDAVRLIHRYFNEHGATTFQFMWIESRDYHLPEVNRQREQLEKAKSAIHDAQKAMSNACSITDETRMGWALKKVSETIDELNTTFP